MKLFKLLWQRYKGIVITVMVIIVGSFGVEAAINVHEWQAADHYMHTEKFAQAYNKSPRDYDWQLERKKDALPVDEFVKKAMPFWNADKTGIISRDGRRNSPSEPYVLFGMLILLAAFVLLATDTAKSFNAMLFSSKFKRTHVLLGKLGILVGLPLLALLVGTLIYYGGVYAVIPHEYLNLASHVDFRLIWMTVAYFVFMLGLVFLTTLIIGQTIWALILMGGFLYSGILFRQALRNVTIAFAGKVLHVSWEDAGIAFEKWWNSAWVNGLVLVAGLAMLVAVFVLYRHFSLERNGNFVMFEKLKWPLWWGTLIYTSFAGIGGSAPWNYLSTGDAPIIILFLVALVAVNITMYILIFKPRSLRHPVKTAG